MSRNKYVWAAWFALVAGLLIFSGNAGNWRTRAISAGTGAAAAQPSKAQAAQALARLPLYFIENRGQADPRARFTLRGGGRTVHLTDSGLLFDFLRYEKKDPEEKRGQPDRRMGRRLVVGLDFENANPRPEIGGQAQSSARFNYLIGSDRSKWVSDVPAFGEVVYRDVYPAVDLRLYDDGGRLRYDFIVRPGGRVEDIRLGFRGIDGLRLDQGELVAETEFGEMRQSEPVIYQETSQGRAGISGGFALEGQSRYAFRVGAYDRSIPLVIDPQVMTLGYSTFLGGSGNERGQDVVWSNGHYFVTGYTTSANFPASTGAFDTILNGTDAFVAKFDPAAASGPASLVWCTFIGGSGNDEARGIDVYSNEAYIAGATYSSDFPMANQGSLNFNDGADIFVTRLNSAGSGLVTSVCLGHPAGGTNSEWANDIAVNSPGTVWICGMTDYGPSLYPGVIGRSEHGNMVSAPLYGDAFMIQVVTSSTPAIVGEVMTFGGQAYDEAKSIAEDGLRIYLTGRTESSDFPTTTGAFQTSHQGSTDAFVFKSDYGGSMAYSTYLGTSANDYGSGVGIGYGGAYVCGYTFGTFASLPNGFDTSRDHSGGYYSGFLVRVNDTAGGSLDYGTYIETQDWGQSTRALNICTAATNRSDCWVTGDTSYYMEGLQSKNYYQDRQSIQDAFVARYDTGSSGDASCLFVTHLGGTANDEGVAVAGSLGRAAVTGWTQSSNFPVSAAAFDSSRNSGEDVFVSTLVEPLLAVTTSAATGVYSTSATLNGSLTNKSGASSLSICASSIRRPTLAALTPVFPRIRTAAGFPTPTAAASPAWLPARLTISASMPIIHFTTTPTAVS